MNACTCVPAGTHDVQRRVGVICMLVCTCKSPEISTACSGEAHCAEAAVRRGKILTVSNGGVSTIYL